MSKNTDSTLALYEDFSLEALGEDREETKKLSEGKMLPALPEGKTVLRMLPPRRGQKTPWRRVYQHYVDIPGLQNTVQFVCPRMEAKLPCKVCTKAKQLQAASNPVDQKRGERLMPKARWFANVLPRKSPESGLKIWGFGKTILDALQEIRDPDQGLGLNFTHPVDGIDLFAMRKGTKQNDTEYKVLVDPNGGSPLAAEAGAMTELLQQMHNLDSMAYVPSAEEIDELLAGRKPERRREQAPAKNEFSGRTAADAYTGEIVNPKDEEELDEDGFPIRR